MSVTIRIRNKLGSWISSRKPTPTNCSSITLRRAKDAGAVAVRR